jgi:hypothetical protein
MEVQSATGQPVGRGRAAAVFGVASFLLLAASGRWAHDWGPTTGSLVAAWGMSTVAAIVLSLWSLDTSGASRWFAKLGIALALVSVLALVSAGVLAAAGIDAAGECGGG